VHASQPDYRRAICLEVTDWQQLIFSAGPVARLKLSIFPETVVALAVTLLILAVVAALLIFWGSGGKPGWVARAICLLLLILCVVAAFFV
jgi:hypothetical protein